MTPGTPIKVYLLGFQGGFGVTSMFIRQDPAQMNTEVHTDEQT